MHVLSPSLRTWAVSHSSLYTQEQVVQNLAQNRCLESRNIRNMQGKALEDIWITFLFFWRGTQGQRGGSASPESTASPCQTQNWNLGSLDLSLHESPHSDHLKAWTDSKYLWEVGGIHLVSKGSVGGPILIWGWRVYYQPQDQLPRWGVSPCARNCARPITQVALLSLSAQNGHPISEDWLVSLFPF